MDIIKKDEQEVGSEGEVKLIQEQTSELKNAMHKAQMVLSDVNNIVSSFEEYQNGLTVVQEKISQALGLSEADSAKIADFKNTSEEAKNEATKQLDLIKEDLATVKEKIAEMEAAYTIFEATNLEISNPDNGLVATLKHSKNILEEVTDFRDKASVLLSEIQTALTSTTENTAKMVEGYSSFESINEKVFSKEIGLEATLSKAQEIKTEIEKLKESSQTINDFLGGLKENSLITDKQISDIKIGAQKNLSKIEEYESNCGELRERMTETLNEASDKTLASAFATRSDKLTDSVKWWKYVIIFSLLMLCLALVYFFGKYSPIHLDTKDPVLLFLYRISLTSPLLYLVFFSISQYSREKNILERYAFKAATGLSLNNYVLILNNQFNTEKNQNQKDNESKIIDFVISSMRGIYEEPYPSFKNSEGFEKVNSVIKKVGDEVVNKIENIKNTVIDSQDTESNI
jgi:hypothetical protein